MIEGWFEGDYFIIFTESEIAAKSQEYGIGAVFPGFKIVGLRGWDELILRDARGSTYTVPTVPMDGQYLSTFVVPNTELLEPDSRFAGRIKWYVQPVIFGGDASSSDNLIWVGHKDHVKLVAWWNQRYKDLKGK